MPTLTAYEIPLSWEPPAEFVTNADGGQYLAWQIGYNTNAATGLWLIYPVVEDPDPLSELIDARYTEYTLTADVERYGHTRCAQIELNIEDLQAKFLGVADTILDNVLYAEI